MVQHFLNQGMIPRQLHEPVVAQQVEARITHVSIKNPVFVEQCQHQCGAHAVEFRLALGQGIDRLVRAFHRFAEMHKALHGIHVAKTLRMTQFFHGNFHGHLCRHFTGKMPPHTVSKGNDTLFRHDEQVVFVGFSHQPHIGGAGRMQWNRTHGQLRFLLCHFGIQ